MATYKVTVRNRYYKHDTRTVYIDANSKKECKDRLWGALGGDEWVYVKAEEVEKRGPSEFFLGSVNERDAFMAGFKAGMRKKSTMVDLADGYTLHIYDDGQMEITKHRPYVFGDSAYAVSTSGRTWVIRVMHDTPINTSFETIDTITSYDPDYSDVVEYLYHLDDGLKDTRFVDKW